MAALNFFEFCTALFGAERGETQIGFRAEAAFCLYGIIALRNRSLLTRAREAWMIDFDDARRRFTTAFGRAGVGLVLAGANSRIVRATEKHDEDDEEDNDKEVDAVEDLMREHGVIRRAILVYRQAAVKLRANPASVDPDALRHAALLFRSFGEDYHEKKLEETHIFPAIKKAGIPAAVYVDILIAQHQRGREITDYVLSASAKGAFGTGTLNRWHAPWKASS
jgi:hypothetical protein